MARLIKGRNASPELREFAREIVRLYREAKESKSGRVCVNPEDEFEHRVYIEYHNVEFLIQILDDLAETGKFVSHYEEVARNLSLNLAMEAKLALGMSKTQAKQEIAQERHRDVRTIERWFSKE